ncbi:MAG: hypothetical protein ACFE0Q_06915 [Anaerolineae bacterium]
MPFWRIRENWQITFKTTHHLHLLVREGFFRDTILLYLDDQQVVNAHAGINGWHGYTLFEIDGRTVALRWAWSLLSGNPKSIVITHKGRILAQYGSDQAADDVILED